MFVPFSRFAIVLRTGGRSRLPPPDYDLLNEELDPVLASDGY
jgi:hypothetical protein